MIGIIDYGMSNLGSVSNAFAFLELPARIVEKPAQLKGCDAMVFPGQGAFGDCMAHLKEHDLDSPIRDWIGAGKPFFGICLGLQTLFEGSEESPGTPGFGILPGSVKKFQLSDEFKVPQIGWNNVVQKLPDCPLFHGVQDSAYFYFVHSFYVAPADAKIVAGETTYGMPYASAVWKDNIMAVQFHPEKSQKIGLRLLRNFADWAYERTQPV
ncbi:MAG TPA: imidazole glycerol phosphate synthase subunit HisH [Kiritimatiellia bacterium]|jgi:glutamine amidotransferase